MSKTQSLDFVAVTKDGLIVYDARSCKEVFDPDELDYTSGLTTAGQQVKVITTLPTPPNAFGHGWSPDGNLLASVCDDGIRVYDAREGYKMIIELPKVAPDVGGRSGGVRNQRFSPLNNFLVTYEKWDPLYPENVHIWDIRNPGKKMVDRKLYSTTLKGYTSGALPVENIKWTEDERNALELVPGEGVVIRASDFGGIGRDEPEDSMKRVPEKTCSNFVVSPQPQNGNYYVCCYMPEKDSMVARTAVYHLDNPDKHTVSVHLPAKVKDAKLMFNSEASELLVLANSDVDETGSSYFGVTFLYWMSSDGKSKWLQLFGAKDGLVQDICWNPLKNEFAAIVGMLPAEIAIYDGKTAKLLSKLGQSKRNTLKWNPFGRLLAVGGFGTLPGDMEFFDREAGETIVSMRAALTVDCCWAPDGKTFLCCTLAPRMNEGNQVTIFRYDGAMLFKIEFKPVDKQGSKIEDARIGGGDVGAGLQLKTQAALYAASWRPIPPSAGVYEDEPPSPLPLGSKKRVKGLPDENAAAASAGSGARAYKAGGGGGYGAGGAAAGGGSMISMMMRGEVAVPADGSQGIVKDQWGNSEVKPLEDWEIKKMQKDAKKEAEKKEQEAKDAEKQVLRDVESGLKDNKKKLKELRKKLEELELLKEKEWDEMTEEDEEEIEKELEIRAEIAKLEGN